MNRSENVKIKINDMPTEFIDESNLQDVTHNGWVYSEKFRGCYILPQSGNLSKYLLRTCLNNAGCSEAATTPGQWKNTWRPIQFFYIVDDFGIEYLGGGHAHHLRQVLQEHYEISEDWK